MVDPAQIAISAFASRAAARAINSLLGPENYSTISTAIDDAFYSLEDESGDTVAVLTDEQYADVEIFLQTREVGSLLQSWTVLKISSRGDAGQGEILADVRSAFENLAIKRCEDQDPPWSSVAGDIWDLITRFVDVAVPALRKMSVSSEDKVELFARFSPGSEILKGGKPSAPKYIRDLVSIFASPARLTNCRNAVSDLRRAAEDAFRELALTHAQDEYRVEVDHLYVDRTLKEHMSGSESESDVTLAVHEGIPRVVVIGDPGAGKSTLVQHTAYNVMQSGKIELAPIVIQCRDYAANAWGSPLVSYISDKLEASEAIKIDDEALVDLLTVGSAYVIFDGVDEIIDLARRRAFIRQIESFGRRFPYIPILATARRVGYARARFSVQDFQVYELDEFSDDQVAEYARKWFDVTRRQESEMQAFLRETESISDVRCNPLMLSLLCTLYRARGFIPRNRRQVYRECSDLLFQRWDAMRQIEQPFDHRQYGQRLMQELARFFYKSQSAQGGLEEQQLVKIIAIFFRDTASIDPPEDHARAQQFVDFCADRAWLLSSKGYNSRGDRLFAFTHRTFMEYYAAECLVRIAQSVDEVADAIVGAFEADPSSVVPDVMVQAVEDKYDRGAEQVLKYLLDRTRTVAGYRDKYLSLCLRIVNSAPMSRAVSESLPRRISDYWKAMPGIDGSHGSSTAFFELYRDPRARMIEAAMKSLELVESGSGTLSGSFAVEICSRWARFEAQGVASYFEPEWSESIGKVFDQLASIYLTETGGGATSQRSDGWHTSVDKIDPALADYLIATGRVNSLSFDASLGMCPRLYVQTYSSASPGSVIEALRQGLLNGAAEVHEHLIQNVDWYMKRVVKHKVKLVDAQVLDFVFQDMTHYWPRSSASEIKSKLAGAWPLRDLALWIMFVTYEAEEYSTTYLHTWFDGVVGLKTLKRLFASRDNHLGLVGESLGRPLPDDQIRVVLEEFGSWARSWVLGDLSLIVSEKLSFPSDRQAKIKR